MSTDPGFAGERPPAGPREEVDSDAPATAVDAEDVLASRGASRWSVATASWPGLPPEVVELLAAPVVVTAARVARPGCPGACVGSVSP
jgi:hypothetical protein